MLQDRLMRKRRPRGRIPRPCTFLFLQITAFIRQTPSYAMIVNSVFQRTCILSDGSPGRIPRAWTYPIPKGHQYPRMQSLLLMHLQTRKPALPMHHIYCALPGNSRNSRNSGNARSAFRLPDPAGGPPRPPNPVTEDEALPDKEYPVPFEESNGSGNISVMDLTRFCVLLVPHRSILASFYLFSDPLGSPAPRSSQVPGNTEHSGGAFSLLNTNEMAK